MNVWSVAGAVIWSLGGGAFLVLALSSWLGKVWAARILEQDRLRYQSALAQFQHDMDQASRRLQVYLDKALHVHRVQFETEFAAMKVIWEKVMKARGTMAALRPVFSIAPVEETPAERDERLQARIREFNTALGELKDAIFNNSPFISEALFHELFDNLLVAAQAEFTSIRVHRPNEDNWYETGEKNLNNFIASAERSSRLIRDRISALAVVPE